MCVCWPKLSSTVLRHTQLGLVDCTRIVCCVSAVTGTAGPSPGVGPLLVCVLLVIQCRDSGGATDHGRRDKHLQAGSGIAGERQRKMPGVNATTRGPGGGGEEEFNHPQ